MSFQANLSHTVCMPVRSSVCIYVYICVQACMPMCAHVEASQNLTVGAFPCYSPQLCVLREGLLLNLELTTSARLASPAFEPQGAF